jgi:hypothetical protein
MNNDPVLMSFNTWRVTQPDAQESGVVMSANDHASRSCTIWWAGPETDFLQRMWDEASARGITLTVHPAKYSRAQLDGAVQLIFAEKLRLRRLGFELRSVGGPNSDFFGLTVGGISTQASDSDRNLPPDLVAVVQGELETLLSTTVIEREDIKIEYCDVRPATRSAVHRDGPSAWRSSANVSAERRQ